MGLEKEVRNQYSHEDLYVSSYFEFAFSKGSSEIHNGKWVVKAFVFSVVTKLASIRHLGAEGGRSIGNSQGASKSWGTPT